MNPTRRRRLAFVALLVLASGVATALVAMALQRNVAYLYTPAEVLRGEAGAEVASGQARFRRRRRHSPGNRRQPRGGCRFVLFPGGLPCADQVR